MNGEPLFVSDTQLIALALVQAGTIGRDQNGKAVQIQLYLITGQCPIVTDAQGDAATLERFLRKLPAWEELTEDEQSDQWKKKAQQSADEDEEDE
jgi:hypothetical protein